MTTSSRLHPRSLLMLAIKAYLPLIGWASLIYLFSAQSSLPGFDAVAGDFILKKGAHMFVYLVLYWLTHRALALTWPSLHGGRLWGTTWLICLCYAITDELHQSMVPGRSPTLRDLGYDSLGMLIAWLRLYRYI